MNSKEGDASATSQPRRKRRLSKIERKAAKRLKRERMEKLNPPTKKNDTRTKTNVEKPRKKKKKKAKQASQQPQKTFEMSLDAKHIVETLLSVEGTLSDRLNPKHKYYDEDLKSKWKSFSKKERSEIVKADHALIKERLDKVKAIIHPFETKEEDHCESPYEAYEDIVPILMELARKLGKTPETLKIYDPYFCAGTVVEHFAKLGFKQVYNKCEDFYDVIARNKIPDHDVVVTNPPYSEWHVKKLLSFSRKNKKPFLLLLPNYFCAKDFYRETLQLDDGHDEPSYLTPRRGRYMYWTPKGLHRTDRQQNHVSKFGFRTSPFVSFWYLDLLPAISKNDLLRWFADTSKDMYPDASVAPWLCRDPKGLPRNSRPIDVQN